MTKNTKILKIFLTYALECPGHFLVEQRTELCKWHCSGVAQAKNVLGAKNGLQGQIHFGLESRDA